MSTRKLITISFFTLLTLFALSCKKENKQPQTNPYPYTGEWKLKSVTNMQYLKYYEQNNGMLSTGFDIINGVATNIKFSAGKSAGTYFISATANLAKYMDINDRGYTYLTSHDFTNSASQLFSVIPVNSDPNKFYIRSVADTTKYLLATKTLSSMQVTTALGSLNDFTSYDNTWILEKP